MKITRGQSSDANICDMGVVKKCYFYTYWVYVAYTKYINKTLIIWEGIIWCTNYFVLPIIREFEKNRKNILCFSAKFEKSHEQLLHFLRIR